MRQPFYMVKETIILNFSNEYHQSLDQLVSSKGFKIFIERYLKDLAIRDIITFEWLTKSRKLEEMVEEIVVLAKQLLVLDLDEIYNPLVEVLNRTKTLFIIEDAYNYWCSKRRFSIINASSGNLTFNSFVEADNRYNQLVLSLYRTTKEKLSGKENNVYRKLQVATNGGCVIKRYNWETFNSYNFLKNVLFVNTVILKTPMMLKQTAIDTNNKFINLNNNPIKNARINQNDWLCYPAKVGDLLSFIYFHKDFIASGLSLANLFELASEKECLNKKPDMIFIYGNQDEKNNDGYYYDETNDIFIGSLSYSFNNDYLVSLKEAILQLHNVLKLKRQQLPISGSMLRVCFSDLSIKSIVLVGDEVSKTQVIETIKVLSLQEDYKKRIVKADIVFDEIGCFKLENNQVVVNGSQIGTVVDITKLNKISFYQDIERAIFLNQEGKEIKVILPITFYDLICASHKIDMLLYVNKDSSKNSLEKIEDIKEAQEIFVLEKIDKSERKLVKNIFDKIFNQLFNDGIYIGQLNIKNSVEDKDAIIELARKVIEKMKEI